MAHRLEKIFKPKTIAAIGASDQEGSVGNALIKNLLTGGFEGKVYPVNPKRKTIQGVPCYRSVSEIPDKVDLAVIATPAKVVPAVVEECGRSGVGGLVVLSAGFAEAGAEGKAMYQDILKKARKYKMRVIGPNCLGFINPSIGINASFAADMALPGNIAFISQSGALCTGILDWSLDQSVGFSHFVSIGSMVDVGFADLIDYFGNDPNTSSILIYMESLKDPRRFMSAARAFARNKPIIVLKSGKSEAGAKASMSHTGSLAGNDAVFEAAFRRAGIIRVETIAQLFNIAQALAMQPLPKGNRLAIVTNAGGPGVLATDYLTEKGGELAQLAPATMERLDAVLPAHWSHNNPVDVLGDAGAEKYLEAVRACNADENVDATLVVLTPQEVTDPEAIAEALVSLKTQKPIFACWMGETEVKEGREILERAKIPNYRYPESAVEVFLKMYKYSKNLELFYETPPNVPEKLNFEKEAARELLAGIRKSGRVQLNELEAKQLLNYYDIATPPGQVLETAELAAEYAAEIGFPVAMKIASPDIAHKTDVGGIKLNLESGKEVKKAFERIVSNAKSHVPDAKIEGVRVEKMIKKPYELLIGSKKDPIFGPVIVFGTGGIYVELYKDTSMGLPPQNMALAQRIIENTKAYKLLQGFRGMPGVDLENIQFLLVKFSYLLMDLPEIKEVDINPYAVDENGGVALDAHIVLDEDYVIDRKRPYDHLVICPYPTQYRREITLKNGKKAILRPIRPEDEPLEAAMFDHVSKQSIYFRFFSHSFDVSHNSLVRYTQIDYDREMAIIALVEEDGEQKMAGVVRVISDAWKETAEYAILVADPWQDQGLGTALTDFILEITQEKGIHKLFAEVLHLNEVMSHVLKKRGFQVVERSPEGVRLELDLVEEEMMA
ncbi:acetate--CoA ligase alpha subunit [Flavilitoribacter nigricans]|uniref:Acetyl CoA synthetase subunit alpha n=1 Tax=Flavilitoribacter nigricans (strain ATCC 23147 / DSM 23189 / NBRC 102662 / NCIMB 1420 / SS-2) TaxID=1122177 RepID=A0A2D0N160_FLAN2|nr:GNAT family N-acetyltransferase [Flavilitoribacter nigricans]PHN02254.1 acetyl CoA synthetase subunit alpha [Flavilitoribacter nigricans DSM 23189 = NBRC 102662]